MEKPVLVGLIFADKIITEDNGKKGIIGTFTSFQSDTFPAVIQPWGIYVAVASIKGKHSFTLNMTPQKGGEDIVNLNGKFEVTATTESVELIINMPVTVFPKDGIYRLKFIVDGNEIGHRNLQALQAPKKG
jgi:hypothetical protein